MSDKRVKSIQPKNIEKKNQQDAVNKQISEINAEPQLSESMSNNLMEQNIKSTEEITAEEESQSIAIHSSEKVSDEQQEIVTETSTQQQKINLQKKHSREKNTPYIYYDNDKNDDYIYHTLTITFMNIVKGANASIFLNPYEHIVWSEGPNRKQPKGICIGSHKQKALPLKSFSINTKELHIQALDDIFDLYINIFVKISPDIEAAQGTIILPPSANLTIESNYDSSSLIEVGSFSINLKPK